MTHTRNFGLKRRTVIEEIAPELAAAIGPAALAELVSIACFLVMLFITFEVFLHGE